MKLRYFITLLFFCLTSALAACSAQTLRDRLEDRVLVSNIQGNKESSQGLSHYIVGLYSEDTGDLDRAIAEYQKALIADPDSSLLHLSLASVFIKKNNVDLAIDQLKQAIGIEPQSIEPHAVLALLYSMQNKEDLATQEYITALKNAARLQPRNVEIYKNLGAVYLQQKKLKEAEGIFKLIVGLAPKDSEAHFYLGSVYFELKDPSSVEKELKAALKLNPNYHQALNFLGYFYLEQNKNIDQAGRLIKKALVFEPENGAYIDSLGWYYFKKGRFKESLAELEKAASLLSDPEIYDHLGEVSLRLGDRKAAKLNWEKSLKLDSTQDKIKAKLLKVTNNGK